MSVQSNSSACYVCSCWKIIGCVYESFLILALHGTLSIRPAGTTVFFPLTLTVASNESGELNSNES